MRIYKVGRILVFTILLTILSLGFCAHSETETLEQLQHLDTTSTETLNVPEVAFQVKDEAYNTKAGSESLESSSSQEKQHSSDKEDGHHSNIPGVGLSIVFIFGSLLYGAMLKLVSRITSVPYNPLLLISGILLGMNYQHLGIIGQATHLMSQVNPNAILAIFLPCLIFESAYKTEWHTFKKLAGQSLIMGILSSIVGASLIMIIIKMFIDQNNTYSWHEALMMGSMLTCTDILSFVHKLKRGGTPQKLTSLIEGESLFNYCTCVLIFQFMQYFAQVKEEVDPWDYIKLFIEEVLGGIVFGVIMGFITVYCIKRMIYDGILVVTLMVIFCYAIYLIAEFSKLRISGIISLSIYGLYMNAFGKTWLFGETEQYCTSFWSYLVFVAETSIFMIAGVLVGANVIHFQSGQININEEYIITIYIYLTALFCRFVSIGVFYRYLKRLGEGINWREIIVLTFAGLKGAIGIALAMLVFKNDHYGGVVSSLIMMHVTTNSLITLIIHGMITGLIVKMLGVSSLKRVQYKFFQQYLYSFEASILERKDKLREQKKHGYEMIEWEEIQKQIGLPQYHQMVLQTEELMKKKQYIEDSKFEKSQMFKLQNVLKNYSQAHLEEFDVLDDRNARFDLEVEYRKRFLKDLIAKYWEFHENNFTTPAALMLLIQSANFDLDKETEEIESWNWIKNEISFNMRIFSELMKLTLINQLAKSHLFEYVSFCYDVVSSYIKANEQVREELEDFYNKSDVKNKEEESHILRNILKESEENQKEAQFFLINYLEPSFPEIEKEVKTRKVSFFILHTFKGIIDKNNQNGQLQPNEYDMLNHIIDSKSLELNLFSPKWQQTNLYTILKENELFKQLPDPVLQLISEQLGEQYTFDANERIMDNSQIAKYFYFVKKGGCIVEFTNENMVYKQPMLAGQVFGFESLLTNIYHSKATANTMAQIVQIKKTLMMKIFETFPQFQQLFWKHHIFQSYKMFVKKDDITYSISHVHKEELIELIEHFKLERIQPSEIEESPKDMIFIRGNVEVFNKDEGSAVKSNKKIKEGQRHSLNSNSSEIATPFSFISRIDEVIIKIREPSYFLIGELDYSMFDRVSSRLSRGGKSWKLSKKNSTP